MFVKRLTPKWTVFNSKGAKSCILTLPGRWQHGHDIAKWYTYAGLKETMIVGITPEGLEWYPMPNGAFDQRDAVMGQAGAIRAIERIVRLIGERFRIPSEKIALCGFSAGAVMAIQTAAHSDMKFAGVVSHAGAILEPGALPKARNEMPVYLMHGVMDMTFSWDERFLPMRRALVEKKYNVQSFIRPKVGHRVLWDDILIAGAKLAPSLGYPQDYETHDKSELTEAFRYVHIR